MFKNLSMWLYDKAPDSEQAVRDTNLLLTNLRMFTFASNLFETNPPVNPDHGQVKRSGLLPVDGLIVQQSVGPENGNRFLPLTQVIRERVVDKGAVKFEVAERVQCIFAMENRRVGRKEMISITDEVIQSMLKDAPIREKRVFGIVTSMGKILVNATGKAAEDYISYIKTLFGEGHIHVRPAELLTWNPECGASEYEDQESLTLFALDRIRNRNKELGSENNATFESLNTFSFTRGNETIAVKCGKDETIDEILSQLTTGDLNSILLAHKHALFNLTGELTLKGIKLQELEYEPENEEETYLSAAYYRFYMSFFLGLFDTIVREVAAVGGDDE
jgi:hypothetical protein